MPRFPTLYPEALPLLRSFLSFFFFFCVCANKSNNIIPHTEQLPNMHPQHNKLRGKKKKDKAFINRSLTPRGNKLSKERCTGGSWIILATQAALPWAEIPPRNPQTSASHVALEGSSAGLCSSSLI